MIWYAIMSYFNFAFLNFAFSKFWVFENFVNFGYTLFVTRNILFHTTILSLAYIFLPSTLKCQAPFSVFRLVNSNFVTRFLEIVTKCSILFCSRFSPLSKTRRPFVMILPVRGATASTSDVGVMSGILDIGT